VSASALMQHEWRTSSPSLSEHRDRDLDQILRYGHGGEFAGVNHRENAMHSLMIAVLSVAALLSVSSSAFAQGAPPAQGAQPIAPRPPSAQGSTIKRSPKMTVLKPGQLYVCPPGYKTCYCNPGGTSRCCLENSACVCENAVTDCR
jgi:hypothetical protein